MTAPRSFGSNASTKASSESVREFLLERGASAIGIAPASRFDAAPPGHSARDCVPEARSVIVFGIKLVSGIVDWPQLVWEQKRSVIMDCWRVYDQCGFDVINMRLEVLAMDLAVAFELGGHQAIFFPGSCDMTVTELNAMRLYATTEYPQPLDRAKIQRLAPDLESPTRYQAPFSFRHAAVAAGLATFGANNLALHPVFGPRIRFNSVITDCEVDQYDDPLPDPVCLHDKGCHACIDTCPHGVFHEVGRFTFAGQNHPWAAMRGNCYYNSVPCGGTCIQTCRAGSGDASMKRTVARRFAQTNQRNTTDPANVSGS